ncbi:phospholipase A and acyltransferase 1-like [Elgaria multicarinata webbii]|uniref:phospholipase A and acyltransferase 1-like n=1 Tax=Elgaria multicarinata webbii TaxID=159646 RepID=UPI002FCD1765
MDLIKKLSGVVMDVVHVYTNKDPPKPGDMIQSQMPGFQHWGIYVGSEDEGVHGDVIHFALPAVSYFPPKFQVRRQKVKDIEWAHRSAVNNKFDHIYPALPPDRIVKRAKHMEDKIMKYDSGSANCEHFATLMRYDIARSEQANRFGFNVDLDFVKEVKGWLAEIGE